MEDAIEHTMNDPVEQQDPVAEPRSVEVLDTNEEKDCLKLLLGGISLDDVPSSAWDDVNKDGDKLETVSPHLADLQTKKAAKTIRKAPNFTELSEIETDAVFARAYKCSGYCTPNGKVERPPLKAVNMGEARGNGLVVTRPIARGEVIYTERAAMATQVPQIEAGSETNFAVRACQHCFRSLEPVSSCQSPDEPLPMPHLWPVLELDFPEDTARDVFRRDKYGRVQCQLCESLFCSEFCRESQSKLYGSCCVCSQAVKSLPKALSTEYETTTDVQPAVALASRMFCSAALHYQIHGSLTHTCFEGLCGKASDVTPLELGVIGDYFNRLYSLEPVYNHLIELLSLNEKEKAVLSLNYFHELAAKAARNGFGIRTQSPFKAYYSSLLRQSGGRGSPQHVKWMAQVAKALGSNSGQLERGMDRSIEEKVAPEIVALFCLTARINHSCDPNAEVRSQEFVDKYIDVVARRDIQAGEELTISYIGVGAGVGKKSTSRRRRQLQAKYLFSCDCELCSTDS